jgi:hypothetical protein
MNTTIEYEQKTVKIPQSEPTKKTCLLFNDGFRQKAGFVDERVSEAFSLSYAPVFTLVRLFTLSPRFQVLSGLKDTLARVRRVHL